MDGGLTGAIGVGSALASALALRTFDWMSGRGERRSDDATEIRAELRADLAAARKECQDLRSALAVAHTELAQLRQDYLAVRAELEAVKLELGVRWMTHPQDNDPPTVSGTGGG